MATHDDPSRHSGPTRSALKHSASSHAHTASGSSSSHSSTTNHFPPAPAAAAAQQPLALSINAADPASAASPGGAALGSSLPEFSLQTCSAQEYLARTIYPTLAPALQLLDDVRPSDPVEYLALQLAKEADTRRERVAQLDQIHQIREQLRAQFKKEYSVAGRI